jgi:hypothetical protein
MGSREVIHRTCLSRQRSHLVLRARDFLATGNLVEGWTDFGMKAGDRRESWESVVRLQANVVVLARVRVFLAQGRAIF